MRRSRVDLWLAAALALTSGVAAYLSVRTMDPHFWDPAVGPDVWFEGDLPRVVDEMTHRWAEHSRATVHPLFSLFSVTTTYALQALSLDPLRSVAAVTAMTAAVWTTLCYALLRLLRHGRAAAVLFTAIALTSGAGVFWLSVPETYAPGSASILLAFLVAAAAERSGRVRAAWFVIGSAASLSVTVTNWMAGIFAARSQHGWRPTLQISANAFVIVVALWAVQRVAVPYADFFIGYSNEQRYLLRSEAGRPTDVLTALLSHSVVMPPIEHVPKPERGMIMSVQRSSPASGVARRSATVLWVALFTCGLWGLAREVRTSPTVRAIALFTVAQIILHLLYGTETFLYTLNLMPLLVVVASLAVRTPLKWPALVVASLLLPVAAVNNVGALLDARSFFSEREAAAAVVAPSPDGDAPHPSPMGKRE